MSFDWGSFVASSNLPRSLPFLLPWLAIGLTATAGPLHHRAMRARYGDARGMLVYFSAFFVFFAVVPIVLVLLLEQDPPGTLASLGLRGGNVSRGLVLCAIAFPVTMLLGFMVSREPAMREQYPFSKDACASDGAFIAYEASYLLLYYTAWEFLYRGLLFFPLLHALGFPAAASITTALSMMAHIGHPDSEIWGALGGGLVFSVLCLLTGSIVYPLLVHAMMGIGNDSFLYARWHRRRAPQ